MGLRSQGCTVLPPHSWAPGPVPCPHVLHPHPDPVHALRPTCTAEKSHLHRALQHWPLPRVPHAHQDTSFSTLPSTTPSPSWAGLLAQCGPLPSLPHPPHRHSNQGQALLVELRDSVGFAQRPPKKLPDLGHHLQGPRPLRSISTQPRGP